MQKVKVSAHLIWIWILSRWKSSVEEADWRPNRISHRSEGFLGFQYHANNKMNTMICEVKCQIWRSMELWKNQCLSYLKNWLDQTVRWKIDAPSWPGHWPPCPPCTEGSPRSTPGPPPPSSPPGIRVWWVWETWKTWGTEGMMAIYVAWWVWWCGM